MRLLVVEDDNRVMAALRTVLARHGFEVSCAGTGAQALEQLQDNPDVVLLDLGLPDEDGFKVCRRIRQLSAVPVRCVPAEVSSIQVSPLVYALGTNVGVSQLVTAMRCH